VAKKPHPSVQGAVSQPNSQIGVIPDFQTCTIKQLLTMAHKFTDANFQSEVLESDKLTVIDLWAEWCGPCRLMNPLVEELAEEYDGRAVVGKLNIDENPEVPTNHNVRGIPTFLFFKNGTLVDRVMGTQTKKSLQDKIEEHI